MDVERNTCPLLVGIQTGATTMYISVESSQGAENRFTIRSNHITLCGIHKGSTSYPKDTICVIAALITIGGNHSE